MICSFNSMASMNSSSNSVSKIVSKWNGSIVSNGAGWLSTNNATNLGTGQFTIEFFLYIPVNPGNTRGILYFGPDTANFCVLLRSLRIEFQSFFNSTLVQHQTATNLSLNKWVHVAVVRGSDNKIRIYQEGTLRYTSASIYTTNLHCTTWGMLRQYSNIDGNYLPNGVKLSGVRISYTARYSGTTITIPSGPYVHDNTTDLSVWNFDSATTYLQGSFYSMTNNGNIQWDSSGPP